MLAEIDGFDFKYKNLNVESIPSEDEIFKRDSQKRIQELFGNDVKEETHANTSGQ